MANHAAWRRSLSLCAAVPVRRYSLPVLAAAGAATAAFSLDAHRLRRHADCSERRSVHVWFVRHAETENNLLLAAFRHDMPEYNRRRSPDSKLSALGRDQVLRLSSHPVLAPLFEPGVAVDLYSSPLARAIQTGAALQQALPERPPIRLRPDLMELGTARNFNVMTPGPNGQALAAMHPHVVLDCAEVPEEGWAARSPVPDDETGPILLRARVTRVAGWVRELQPSVAGAHVVIIGHGALLAVLIGEILDVGHRKAKFKHGNVAVTHLEIRGDTTLVHCINAEHLESGERRVERLDSQLIG